MDSYKRAAIEAALDHFGVEKIRLGVRAFKHAPRGVACGCFIGEMEGLRWVKNAFAYEMKHRQLAERVMRICVPPNTWGTPGEILSEAYEEHNADFQQIVLDWLARQDAIGEVTQAAPEVSQVH